MSKRTVTIPLDEYEKIQEENESLKKEVACLKGKYNRCRNELCLRCGRYKKSHLGACDGCVFIEMWGDNNG